MLSYRYIDYDSVITVLIVTAVHVHIRFYLDKMLDLVCREVKRLAT